MNESAKRRQDLLNQMRNSNTFHSIPPVHPNYRTTYRTLYSDKDINLHNGSFLFRFTIAVICFLSFVWMDSSKTPELSAGSAKIVTQIENTINFNEIQEVWKEL